MDANTTAGLLLLVAVFCSLAGGLLVGFAATVVTWNAGELRTWFVGRTPEQRYVFHRRLR